jgi:hypothetical protein
MRFWFGSKETRRATTRHQNSNIISDPALGVETPDPPAPAETHFASSSAKNHWGPPAESVTQWRDGGGRLPWDEVGTAYEELKAAYQLRGRDRFHAACLRLRGTVEEAQRYGSVPDKEAQLYWSNYLRARILAASIGEIDTRSNPQMKLSFVRWTRN